MPLPPGETSGPGERFRSDDPRSACEAAVRLGRAAPIGARDGWTPRLADQPRTIAPRGLRRGRDRERQAFSEGEVPTHGGESCLQATEYLPSCPRDKGEAVTPSARASMRGPVIGFASRL